MKTFAITTYRTNNFLIEKVSKDYLECAHCHKKRRCYSQFRTIEDIHDIYLTIPTKKQPFCHSCTKNLSYMLIFADSFKEAKEKVTGIALIEAL